MADMFADRQLKAAIIKIIERGYHSSDEVLWFNNTKNMFHNYPAIKVFEQVQIALEEASDEQWFENKYPKEVFEEKFVKPKLKKRERKVKANGSGVTAQIVAKVSIIGIADKHGLRPLGKLKRACPFHADKNPSLSLNDEKGLFNCFGCSAKGNIIDFIYLLRKNNIGAIKNGK